MKRTRRRTSVPYENWPEIDQKLGSSATGEGGSILRRGKAEHWAPTTKKQVAKGYGKWLCYLQESDQLDPETIPSRRVTEETLFFS